MIKINNSTFVIRNRKVEGKKRRKFVKSQTVKAKLVRMKICRFCETFWLVAAHSSRCLSTWYCHIYRSPPSFSAVVVIVVVVG